MTIPLQPVNLEPYARNPMLTAEQIGQGLDNMQAQAQRTQAMHQQAAQQQQLFPGQLQLQKDQLETTQEKAALEQKYPELAFGPQGASFALLDYMKQNQGAPPPGTAPPNAPPPNGGMGIPYRPSTPPVPHNVPQASGGIGMPSGVPNYNPGFPTIASSLAKNQPPIHIQMPLGGLSSPPPMPSAAPPSQVQSAPPPAPPHQDVNAYAQNFIQAFQKKATPYNASDFGIHMNDPAQQEMANAIISKAYPMSYGEMASNMLPLRSWEYAGQPNRDALTAVGVAYGMSRDNSVGYFSRGGTVQGLEKATGIPLSQIHRQYAPTNTTVSHQQASSASEAALNAVMPDIIKYTSPYVGTNIAGFNAKEMTDFFNTQKSSDVGNYLGAQAAQYEAITRQIVRAGGRPTDQQTSHLAKLEFANPSRLKTMLEDKVITPAIYTQALNVANDLGDRMSEAQEAYVNQQGVTQIPFNKRTSIPSALPTKGAIGPQTDLPSYKGGDKNAWFDSLTPSQKQQVFGGSS